MKILIIKLGAKGDVVRTLSILPAIKEKYPESEIFWVTKTNSVQIFENNPYIKKVFSIPFHSNEKFDILYSLDTEEEATLVSKETKAEKKFGFYTQEGFPAAYNLEAEYYLNTMFDDELKVSNKKTYQEMIFSACELEWKKQPAEIFLSEKDKEYSDKFTKNNKITKKRIIGIHIGASSRWPSKVWHKECLKEFIRKASKKHQIILFGGPNEAEEHKKLISELKSEKISVFQNNPNNTDREFISLVNLCEVMVCSDSLALHISLALKKKTVGLFFCTSPDEVESYGLLKKLVSPKLYEFFPQKMNQYSEELTKSISAKQVLDAIEND